MIVNAGGGAEWESTHQIVQGDHRMRRSSPVCHHVQCRSERLKEGWNHERFPLPLDRWIASRFVCFATASIRGDCLRVEHFEGLRLYSTNSPE